MRPRQMQCQTILHLRLPHPEARHSLSAAQEKVRCSLRIQKRRSSAVPLCRLRTWQARSQQQNIRLLLLLRGSAWQEICPRRTAAYSQHLHQAVRQENSQLPIRQMPPILHRSAIPQEMARGHSNRAARRMRQHPVQQERSARPSTDAIPSPCSRRHAFPRMETPRSRSRTIPQIGSILHPQCRHLRQRRLPTAKPVHPRARPRGLMQRVRQNSALRSAQFPHKAAAQKSRYRRLAHKLLLFPPLLPNGRAGNRRPRLLWAA